MRFILIAICLVLSSKALTEELIVGTLNTESAADTNVFAVSQVIRDTGFADIWAFQEVEDLEALTEYTVAAGATANRINFRRVISESGTIASQHRKHDFLGIVYNSTRLRQVETVELHGIRSNPGSGRLGKPDWGLRGALLMRFQDKQTGAEFYLGNVHLKCCGRDGPGIRAHQAEILKEWIERTNVPVIMAGDFNIPVDPTSGDGTDAEAFVTLSSVMDWMSPENPIKTFCGTQNSMLDHVFVKSGPNLEPIDSVIEQTDEAFCEAEKLGGPDHRPLIARFQLR